MATTKHSPSVVEYLVALVVAAVLSPASAQTDKFCATGYIMDKYVSFPWVPWNTL